MFMGEYEHAIDEKGRIIIPTRFREQLGEKFVLARGTDGCLAIYPADEWEKFVSQLHSAPGDKNIRQIQRYFLAGAVECDCDKQGRVIIPQRLREDAGIVKELVSVGMMNKVEVWSKERWESNSKFDSVDEALESLAGYGISF